MTSRVFDTPAPRLFTIPPQVDFLRAIARTLREEFGAAEDPDALTRILLLTPTRRAAKALGDIFAELAGGGVALLPMIRPIGDIDVDDPPFEPGELAGLAPPAISATRRRFELARLILAKEAALERPLGIGGALALAEPLAALLDDLADEGVDDLSALSEALDEHLPADKREAVEFLEIVQSVWPARLAELGLTDSAARRTLVLKALAARWRDTPPDHPVLVIGSTGSIPAARDLMQVVAGLPQGAVILPGFDWDADDVAWEHVGGDHPQWAMKAFIDRLGLDRRAVAHWPGAAEPAPAQMRRRVIAEALRPADTTDEWLERLDRMAETHGPDFFRTGIKGLSLIETADDIGEARTCALLLREVLETPGKTGVLVTPDRTLARRVAVEMARFGVRLDDSGGAALGETPAGAFLTRVLDVALDPGSVVALSALWGSPLFTAGERRGAVHTVLATFEAEALRGVRPGRDLAAVRARLDGKRVDLFDADRAAIERVLSRLEAALALLTPEPASARIWAERHARAVEALAATHAVDGSQTIWAAPGGDEAAQLVRALLEESDSLPEMRLADYAAALRELMAARRVPPRLGVHPRLQVLGPLEARLIRADRVVLAGLNDGVWPRSLGTDPWMSRGMRIVAGLGAPERRHGLAAHDFTQLAAGAEVFLTRALKTDGTPTVASRWIWRLQTLAEGALGREAAQQALAPAVDYPALARALDDPGGAPAPAPRPEPRPPVSARPRQLSITEIRTWIRDPYSIFARHVLGLRKLDPADMPPGPRERGTALHEALQIVVPRWGDELPAGAEADLVDAALTELAATGFLPEDLALERARFQRAARWLVAWEQRRRAAGIRFDRAEVRGTLELAGPGGPWTLTGRADRFDRHPDGRLDIIDYKTGSAASAKEVGAGFDPQLPLTAATAQREDGFDTLLPGAPAGLYYVCLPGNAEGGREVRIDGGKNGEAGEMAERAVEELTRWIARFDDETMPYESQTRAKYVNQYGDFDHLARRGEWASAPGGEESEA